MLNANEKIIRCRVKLQKSHPFFSYLCMHLRLDEDKRIGTIGVNQYGDMKYNPEYINELSNEELKGVLCHEILHCSFEHFDRMEKRDIGLWNLATDIIINNLLVNNQITLPKSPLVPINNEIILRGFLIKELDKKCAEDIYRILLKVKEKKGKRGGSGGKGNQKGRGNGADKGKSSKTDEKMSKSEGGFDYHIVSDSGLEKSCDSRKKMKDWKKILVEASVFAQQRGTAIVGMDRYIDKLLHSKLNWKALLYRYISNEIPHDFNWSFPSKKSISVGVYLPSVLRESLDIMVSIDTSGSVDKVMLTAFVSELIGISNSFNNVNIKIVVHDYMIHEEHNIRGLNKNIVNTIKFKGGGGTSHKDVFRYAEKNRAKLLICFTDGYSDLETIKTKIKTLFVVPKTHGRLPFGQKIVIT